MRTMDLLFIALTGNIDQTMRSCNDDRSDCRRDRSRTSPCAETIWLTLEQKRELLLGLLAVDRHIQDPGLGGGSELFYGGPCESCGTTRHTSNG